MEIRYLHLSDLHLTGVAGKSPKETFNQDVVTQALVQTVKTLEASIDFIIITGDVAYSGQPADYDVCRVFCDELLQAARLEPSRLFIIPGNHDVDRAKITRKHIKSFYPFDDQDDITETLTDPDILPIIMRKLAAFNAFAADAMGSPRFSDNQYHFTTTLPIIKNDEECRIGLVGLNSCLFAGYDEDEQQKLALGLVQVQAALKDAQDADLWISFWHHPFACLHPADKVCRNKLTQHSDLILYGHLHDPSNMEPRDAAGQSVIIGAGAGYEGREHANSFNVCEIDLQTGVGRVEFYKYLPHFDRWKKDTDVNPDEAEGSFSFTVDRLRSSEASEAVPEPSAAPIQVNHINLSESKRFEPFYLKRLIAQCDHLDLSAIDETCIPGHEGANLKVSDVFTTLFLKGVERLEDQSVADVIAKKREALDAISKAKEKERIPIQAVEAAGAVDHLVILGRPGGGKSTLVNHIASQLARRRKGDDAGAKDLPGWPSHQNPLPVRIIMRQLAAWLPDDRRQISERIVWEYLQDQLKEMGCGEFFPALKHTLDAKGGVIFFDGLDEVREADEDRARTHLIQAMEAFARPLDQCRIIITCREYAYRQTDAWRLPEAVFPVVELDLFRNEQIQAFTRTWYRQTGPPKGWNEKRCDDEATKLYQAVSSLDHLKELAQYPLLLTLMAQVHGRDGYLPQDRADLYDRAVKLLLSHWENRIVRDADGGCTVEPGLVMKLGVRAEVLRQALERVALAAHTRQEMQTDNRSGCADIAREDLRQELADGLGGGLDRAEEVIRYIRNRAGLLHARDNRTFAFPHRTFQEYLAASAIIARSDFEDFLGACIRRDQAWWQEVFLLAAGALRKTPKFIYYMVDTLLPDEVDQAPMDAATVSYAQLAARAMSETDFIKHVSAEQKGATGRYAKIHQRVQNWLITAMQADDTLSPQERCEAGNALNWVGDPRFNPEKWFLPDDDDLGFVEIPAGPFLMGSDENKDSDADDDEFPEHTVDLSVYAIARFPVTVAQFRAFVKDSGYEADEDYKRSPDNHPVVWVSWDDATAYCEWLTEKLDNGTVITLPTEAQWEKAARGTDGKIYPWGDKIDANRANYTDTGIRTTSPVGCFPNGNSEYGLVDVSGNVWEWCQDWFGEYPDEPVVDPKGPSDGEFRVLRGGCWFFDGRFVRSADRFRDEPGFRDDLTGFRLARGHK